MPRLPELFEEMDDLLIEIAVIRFGLLFQPVAQRLGHPQRYARHPFCLLRHALSVADTRLPVLTV